jgi:hypothetical protein
VGSRHAEIPLADQSVTIDIHERKSCLAFLAKQLAVLILIKNVNVGLRCGIKFPALGDAVVDLVKPSMSKPRLDSFCVMRPSPSISNILNTKPWHDSMWKSILVILPSHVKTSNPALHSVLESLPSPSLSKV